MLNKSNQTEKHRIARYLYYLVLMGDMDELAGKILATDSYRELFNSEEISEIQKRSTTDDIELPSLLVNDDWGVTLVTYTRECMIKTARLNLLSPPFNKLALT